MAVLFDLIWAQTQMPGGPWRKPHAHSSQVCTRMSREAASFGHWERGQGLCDACSFCCCSPACAVWLCPWLAQEGVSAQEQASSPPAGSPLPEGLSNVGWPHWTFPLVNSSPFVGGGLVTLLLS